MIRKHKTRILVYALLAFLFTITAAVCADYKLTFIQTNFTAGQLSEKLAGRVDLAKYFNGLKTLENFIIYPQGGVTRRPGFKYIASQPSATPGAVRLIPFEFSTTQAYILELGNLYMRFYMNGGQIVSPDVYTKLLLHCNGNDGSTTFTDEVLPHTVTAVGDAQIDDSQSKFSATLPASGLFDGSGDYLSIPDHADWFMGTAAFTIDFWWRPSNINLGKTSFFFTHCDTEDCLNDRIFCYYIPNSSKIQFYIVDGAATTILLESSAWTPTIGIWYHIAIIRGWGGNANDWAITVNGVAIGTLTDASSWPNVGPWLFCVGGGLTRSLYGHLDEFRVSKGIARWTANFTPPTAEYSLSGATYQIGTPYLTEHLPQIKYAQSADIMWLVHPSYQPRKLTRTGHAAWTLTAYAPTANPFTSTNNYPAAVAFFEERLWFAGPNASPQEIFSTKSGDFENMTTGANDDDAIDITIAADQVNRIRWMEPGKVLTIGTVGGEWRLGATSLNEPVAPDNIVIRRESAYGSADIQPETVGPHILFVQKAGLKIREYKYNYELDGYLSVDLNILSDDITEGGLKYLAYQQEPHSILWAVRSDGILLGLTYQRDHDVIGWHKHTIGGTDSELESIAVIPGTNEDELWASIKTEVSNTEIRFITQMQDIFSANNTTGAFFLDCGLTYDGAETLTVTGLDHLVGETCQVLADGLEVDDEYVSGGEVTLDATASEAHFGFSYNSNLETLRLEREINGQTIQGKTKRISEVRLRLLESKECKIGPDADNLDSVDFDTGTAVYTGDKMIEFDGPHEEEGRIYVRQDQPLPLTILAIISEFFVSDE